MRVIPHVQWCSQKWKAVVENLFKKYFELKVIYYIIVFFSLNCDFYCKKKETIHSAIPTFPFIPNYMTTAVIMYITKTHSS